MRRRGQKKEMIGINKINVYLEYRKKRKEKRHYHNKSVNTFLPLKLYILGA